MKNFNNTINSLFIFGIVSCFLFSVNVFSSKNKTKLISFFSAKCKSIEKDNVEFSETLKNFKEKLKSFIKNKDANKKDKIISLALPEANKNLAEYVCKQLIIDHFFKKHFKKILNLEISIQNQWLFGKKGILRVQYLLKSIEGTQKRNNASVVGGTIGDMFFYNFLNFFPTLGKSVFGLFSVMLFPYVGYKIGEDLDFEAEWKTISKDRNIWPFPGLFYSNASENIFSILKRVSEKKKEIENKSFLNSLLGGNGTYYLSGSVVLSLLAGMVFENESRISRRKSYISKKKSEVFTLLSDIKKIKKKEDIERKTHQILNDLFELGCFYYFKDILEVLNKRYYGGIKGSSKASHKFFTKNSKNILKAGDLEAMFYRILSVLKNTGGTNEFQSILNDRKFFRTNSFTGLLIRNFQRLIFNRYNHDEKINFEELKNESRKLLNVFRSQIISDFHNKDFPSSYSLYVIQVRSVLLEIYKEKKIKNMFLMDANAKAFMKLFSEGIF